MTKLYHDIESDEILTLEQLKSEYEKLKASGETEAECFHDYLTNCTSKNGTLELIK